MPQIRISYHTTKPVVEGIYSTFQDIPDYDNVSSIEITIQYREKKIRELPTLPKNLLSLDVACIGLKKLPELPHTLVELICNDNYLKELPHIPSSLKILDCSNNNILTLPTIPYGILDIDFSFNTNININNTTFPHTLKHIRCCREYETHFENTTSYLYITDKFNI
jgi:Leucine-rich repeat (LRR) protein